MSSPHAVGASAESTKFGTVIVNGTPKEVSTRELTFEQVVELAFPNNPWGNPNTIYTVAYRRMPDYTLLEYICEDNREYADEEGVTRLRLHDDADSP